MKQHRVQINTENIENPSLGTTKLYSFCGCFYFTCLASNGRNFWNMTFSSPCKLADSLPSSTITTLALSCSSRSFWASWKIGQNWLKLVLKNAWNTFGFRGSTLHPAEAQCKIGLSRCIKYFDVRKQVIM
jgi:hypothetical protein